VSSRRKSNPSSQSEVLDTERVFGAPPILPGEDAAAYEALLARVSADVKPADIIEKIWVRDVVDHTWEIFRWRRIKKTLVSARVTLAHREIFTSLLRATPEFRARSEDSR
jgi:hypothetical protein